MKAPLPAAALATAFMTTTVPVVAATVSTVSDGGVICDSYNHLVASTRSLCPSTTNFDLGQTIGSGDALTFEGSGTLIGFVRDQQGPSNNYADAATITLDSDSQLTFSLMNFDSIFTGTLSFGSLLGPAPVLSATNTTVSFFAAAGTYAFSFDATVPNETQDNTTEYALEVSAVPLPASSLLLLAGLGAFGAMRRNKRA